jgi:recombination protein RecT
MAVNNTLAHRPAQRLGMTAYLNQDAVKAQITSIVGSKRGTSFITSIVSAVQTNPALQECTNPSILSAALLGESLNLSPSASLGQFWIIPFNNKKKGVKEAQFQLGANGYKQLAMRTGQYKDIDFIEIHEGEYKGRDKFTGKQVFEFIEDDDLRESLPVVGYMAYFELLNGFRKSVYWTKAKMEKHADQYSQAFSLDAYRKLQAGQIPSNELWKYSSYWYSNFAGMAEKTLIKHLLSKWGILSTELITAMDADMAIINEDGSKTYVETEQDVIDMPVENLPEPQEEKTEDSVIEPATDAKSALFGK